MTPVTGSGLWLALAGGIVVAVGSVLWGGGAALPSTWRRAAGSGGAGWGRGGEVGRWRFRGRSRAAIDADVAEAAELTALCLDAGLTVPAALQLIPRAEELLAHPEAGDILGWSWTLAERLGVPIADATRVAAQDLRARSERAVQAQTLAAGPKASMGLLAALPVVGPLLAVLIGVPVAEVYGSPVALAGWGVGICLAAIGWRWGRRILAKALAPRTVRLLTGSRASVLEVASASRMLALGLRSGIGSVEALEAVAALEEPGVESVVGDLGSVASALRWGRSAPEAWSMLDEAWQPVALLWTVAGVAGAAPAALIEAAAGRVVAAESARTAAAVQRASVHLVLPLGACFLPAFLLTTIVPVVTQTAGALLAG